MGGGVRPSAKETLTLDTRPVGGSGPNELLVYVNSRPTLTASAGSQLHPDLTSGTVQMTFNASVACSGMSWSAMNTCLPGGPSLSAQAGFIIGSWAHEGKHHDRWKELAALFNPVVKVSEAVGLTINEVKDDAHSLIGTVDNVLAIGMTNSPEPTGTFSPFFMWVVNGAGNFQTCLFAEGGLTC